MNRGWQEGRVSHWRATKRSEESICGSGRRSSLAWQAQEFTRRTL